MNDLENNKGSDQLISDQESYELSMSGIDRVDDGEANTQADLKAFVDEQQAQAKSMIDARMAEVNGLSPELVIKAKEINKKTGEKIDAVVVDTLKDLRIETVQVCASKLSDIVGFKLEVDILGHDQFGLDKRYTDREVRVGRGFAGYENEDMSQSRDYIGGEFFEAELAEGFKKEKQANLKEVSEVMQKMRKFGDVAYEKFEKEGPVLVIVPELHYDSSILKNNFEMMDAVKSHMDFLASEGFDREVTQDDLGTRGVTTKKEKLAEIDARKIAISSVALEDVYGADIKTVGVDETGLVAIVQNKFIKRDIDRKLGLSEAPEKNVPTVNYKAMTNGEMARYGSSKLLDLGEMGTLIVNYRNSIWLSNIRNRMMYDTNPRKKSSNIVFLVCGAAHEANLTTQAQEMGFSGIVHFTPNAFNEPFDEGTILAYAKNQLNRE